MKRAVIINIEMRKFVKRIYLLNVFSITHFIELTKIEKSNKIFLTNFCTYKAIHIIFTALKVLQETHISSFLYLSTLNYLFDGMNRRKCKHQTKLELLLSTPTYTGIERISFYVQQPGRKCFSDENLGKGVSVDQVFHAIHQYFLWKYKAGVARTLPPHQSNN